MEIAVPSLLRQHLRILQFVGYLPLSLDTNAKNPKRIERLQRLWTLVLLGAYSCLASVVLTSDDVFLFSADTFGYFNDTMKLMAAQFAVTVSYGEAVFRREALRHFWLIHTRLQRLSKAQLDTSWWQQLIQYKRYFVPYYMVQCAELLMLVFFFTTQEPMTRHLMLFWCMFWPYIYIIRFRTFQCNLHMELIREQLLTLSADLSLLVVYTNFAPERRPFKGFSEYVRLALLKLQRRYTLIYELYVEFQRALGCSMLAVLLMIYVRVLVDTYFFYYTVYRGWCNTENFLLLPTIAEIPILLLTSKACMNAVDEVIYQLHNINTQATGVDARVSRQLQNFALQIRHQKLRIDGVGIQVLDGYMLTKAVTSITTYMIFFVQFMPKFRNHDRM